MRPRAKPQVLRLPDPTAGITKPTVEQDIRSGAERSFAFTHAAMFAHITMPLFICPKCGRRFHGEERKGSLSSAPKGCVKCDFPIVFELLDDYYPAPGAAFFICDQQGRIIGCGKGVFELTGLTDEQVLGQLLAEAVKLSFSDGVDHIANALEWTVRVLGKEGEINPLDINRKKVRVDLFPAYDEDGGMLAIITPAQ